METTGSVPRLRKREFFSSLGYEPHAGQVLVHKSKAPRRVLACGVRWGKSRCAAMEAVAALFEPRDGRTLGWTCAPTYGLARRIFDEAIGVIHTHLAHRILVFDQREHRIVVSNFGGGTSELRGKSCDNATSLLGEGLDFLILDEATRISEEVWTQHLSQRLIDRKGWALLLSTPRSGGWYRKLYRRGQRGRDPAYESWSSPSWTNPHLDKEVIEAERARLTDAVFRQEYGGEFVTDEIDPCEVCHGPSPTACSVILLNGDEQVRTCHECGRPVNEHGETMVALWDNGQEHFSVIQLMERSGESPALPFVSPEAKAEYEAREARTVHTSIRGVLDPVRDVAE